MNNADAFAFGGSEVGRFVQCIEGAEALFGSGGAKGCVKALLFGLSGEASATEVGEMRHGSKRGGGLFPRDGHTISGFSG